MHAITLAPVSEMFSPSFDICALLFSRRQTINSASVVLNGFDRCKLIVVNKFKERIPPVYSERSER